MMGRPNIESALRKAGLNPIWYHVNEKRQRSNAKERPGQMLTTVAGMATDRKTLEDAAAAITAANPDHEVIVFYGDEDKNLRPLIKVWW